MRAPLPTVACVLAVLALGRGASPAGAQPTVVVPGFEITAITAGLIGPVALAPLPDGRVLVTERFQGRLRMIKNDLLLPQPVANFDTNVCRERGLIGVAIDPDFASNRWVYCFYSRSSLPGQDTAIAANIVDNRVVRITLDADTMLAGSEVLIRSLPTDPLLCAHIAGNLHFAPDGTLLVSYGDGEIGSPSLDLTSLRGKLLRLDPATGQAAPDNFFALDGNPQTLPEIWAYGLRNTFDFTLERGTGRVYATENGGHIDDEVNLLVERGDYGWPLVEGFANLGSEQSYQSTHPDYRNPLWATGDTTICPTGIVAVDAARWGGAYAGRLLFAVCNEPFGVRMLTLDATGQAVTGPAGDFATGFAGSVIDLEFDGDDNLWLTTFNTVYRIRPLAGTPAEPAPGGRLVLAHGGRHPDRGGATLRRSVPAAGTARLTVQDLRGRTVRVLWAAAAEPGPRIARWDGRDGSGRRAAPGMYFARLAHDGGTRSLPVLLLD
jgi:glucose/arabinose dehydrogenase